MQKCLTRQRCSGLLNKKKTTKIAYQALDVIVEFERFIQKTVYVSIFRFCFAIVQNFILKVANIVNSMGFTIVTASRTQFSGLPACSLRFYVYQMLGYSKR